MKLLVFNVGKHSKKERKSARINVERILFFSFIIAFALLIIIQTALTNPSIRTFITGSSEYEGKPLGSEEFLYDEGEIIIRLLGTDADSDVKVLLNGDEVEVFTGDTVKVTVKDGDIVEVDANDLKEAVEVSVVSKSENISSDCLKDRIRVQSGIKRLTRIKME